MIAIHEGNKGFSGRWIEYCKLNNLEYKIVNCYDSDIITQLQACKFLMWHWHHADAKAILFARQLIYSIEMAGVKVFPDSNTCWHFDDKIGQKYLLEAVKAPLISSQVFYDKAETLKWLKTTEYPFVFKLRNGAGSTNVSLVKTYKQGIEKANKAFGKGFENISLKNLLDFRVDEFKKVKSLKNLLRILRSCSYYAIPNNVITSQRERGYFYVQKFIPNNSFDIRIIIVNNKAIAIKRYVRKGDFRASGSGNIEYDFEMPANCLKAAFDVHNNIKSQCTAFDFVFDENKNPLIVEIGYAFTYAAYDKCIGYWDENLNFYNETINLQYNMVESLINS